MQMVPLSATKHVLWLRVLNNVMDMIMRIHSAQLLSLPLFDFFCLWQFLADGLSISLTCKTLFFTDCLKKRFT